MSHFRQGQSQATKVGQFLEGICQKDVSKFDQIILPQSEMNSSLRGQSDVQLS